MPISPRLPHSGLGNFWRALSLACWGPRCQSRPNSQHAAGPGPERSLNSPSFRELQRHKFGREKKKSPLSIAISSHRLVSGQARPGDRRMLLLQCSRRRSRQQTLFGVAMGFSFWTRPCETIGSPSLKTNVSIRDTAPHPHSDPEAWPADRRSNRLAFFFF